jgi:hypothetical protein
LVSCIGIRVFFVLSAGPGDSGRWLCAARSYCGQTWQPGDPVNFGLDAAQRKLPASIGVLQGLPTNVTVQQIAAMPAEAFTPFSTSQKCPAAEP